MVEESLRKARVRTRLGRDKTNGSSGNIPSHTIDRTPSFYTSRSVVNLSGLGVSDPHPRTLASSHSRDSRDSMSFYSGSIENLQGVDVAGGGFGSKGASTSSLYRGGQSYTHLYDGVQGTVAEEGEGEGDGDGSDDDDMRYTEQDTEASAELGAGGVDSNRETGGSPAKINVPRRVPFDTARTHTNIESTEYENTGSDVAVIDNILNPNPSSNAISAPFDTEMVMLSPEEKNSEDIIHKYVVCCTLYLVFRTFYFLHHSLEFE